MKKTSRRIVNVPNTGNEEIPPGATAQAADRPINPDNEPPESAAGPRHAADDPGSPVEEYGATDSNQPLAEAPQDEPNPLEEGPPYAGISGGAVRGSPAEMRSSGGTTGGGLAPGGTHRGDSTIGSPTAETPKKKTARRHSRQRKS